VKVIAAQDGRVEPTILLGLEAAAEADLDARPSHHDSEDGEHEHDDFESFVITMPEQDSPEALIERLRDATERHDILRLKGFIAVAGKPMRLEVQGVGPRIRQSYDRPWRGDERQRAQLVIIGQKGFDRSAIEAAILT
jgi:cobalamin biosynthesis protein CobW